jgi:hypothetical protein
MFHGTRICIGVPEPLRVAMRPPHLESKAITGTTNRGLPSFLQDSTLRAQPVTP